MEEEAVDPDPERNRREIVDLAGSSTRHPTLANRGIVMTAKKKSSWGGARRGAGRPKGSGSGPSPNARKNRVAVMLTDTELLKIGRVAKRMKVPIATLAYEMIAKGLKSLR